jgi:hypothetical protein
MSKLADLIRRIARIEPPALGFSAGPKKAPPTMIIVGLAGDHWSRTVTESPGADVLLFTGRPREQDIADAASASGERPCGAIVGEADGDSLARMRSFGLDFVVLSTHSPASALLDEDLGFVLQLKEDLDDIQLKTLEGRPLDALFLEHDTHPFTIRKQIEFQRISGLARKPLLVPVRSNIEEPDLLALREAGATLLALDLGDRGASEALARLRAVIDGLPPRRKLRTEEREVSILGAVRSHEHEDDDFDDE